MRPNIDLRLNVGESQICVFIQCFTPELKMYLVSMFKKKKKKKLREFPDFSTQPGY